MKNILCFGDSNTHGNRPDGKGRFDRDTRWTGRLQKQLGPEYYVIEEGLGGRTSTFDDPVEWDRNGRRQLPISLESHAPLDLVIIMLGTNDLKLRFSATPMDIAKGFKRTIKMIKSSDNYGQPLKILLMAPTYVREENCLGETIGNRKDDSLHLGELLEQTAKENGIEFLNIAEVSGPSYEDGLHFDQEGHRKVADAVEKKVREILG